MMFLIAVAAPFLGGPHFRQMTFLNKFAFCIRGVADWETWYEMWFQQAFTERMGFEPTDEAVRYALEKYAEISV